MPGIFSLIRWKNLLMIAIVQFLLKYALFEPFGIAITLNWFGFSLLVLATVCIAAAGNIINDIYDVESDRINKPNEVIIGKSVSEKVAYNIFFALNVTGVGLGFYLSNLIGQSGFSVLFVAISILLYVYASYLKQLIFIKNLVIASLVAMSIIIVPLFDLLPAVSPQNQETQLTIFKIVLDYALFAFGMTLVREMVKDLQDVDGDRKAGLNTLPIFFGSERTSKSVFIILLFFTGAVVYYIITYLYKQPLAVGYFGLFVIAPLIYSAIKLFQAKSKVDFKRVSTLLKVTMLLGMLSLLLYPFILK